LRKKDEAPSPDEDSSFWVTSEPLLYRIGLMLSLRPSAWRLLPPKKMPLRLVEILRAPIEGLEGVGVRVPLSASRGELPPPRAAPRTGDWEARVKTLPIHLVGDMDLLRVCLD